MSVISHITKGLPWPTIAPSMFCRRQIKTMNMNRSAYISKVLFISKLKMTYDTRINITLICNTEYKLPIVINYVSEGIM